MKPFATALFVLSATFCLPALCSARDSAAADTMLQMQHSSLSFIVDYGLAQHSAAFAKLPEVESCCSDYRAGHGTGTSLLASYRILGSADSLGLHLSAGMGLLSAPMSTYTKEVVDYRGSAALADIRHDLEMAYWHAMIGVSGTYQVVPWLNVSVGLSGCFPLSLRYQTSEILLSPQGLIFETGSSIRNVTTGRLSSGSASFLATTALAGPELSIGKTITLQPRIAFSPWFTSISSVVDWSVYAVSAGVRVSFNREVKSTDAPPIVFPQSSREHAAAKPEENKRQEIAIKAGVRNRMTGDYMTEVRIPYSVKRRRLAMLPSVFFDSAKADIPVRFLSRKVFSADNVSERIHDIDVSHSVIHIVGTVLQRQTSSAVTITGSHAEDGPIAGRQQLAYDRAEVIKRFLVSNYGISPNRILTKARAFPERPSGASTPNARAENRRCDFEFRNAELNLPVQQDTFMLDSVDNIEINFECTRPESLTKVSVLVLADGREIAKHNTMVTGNSLVFMLPLSGNATIVIAGAKNVEVEVSATDTVDGSLSERIEVFRVIVEESKVAPLDEFGIVLFDYNSALISDSERGVLDELRKRAAVAQRIVITGTSDESGIESINRKLAEDRALSVARELRLKEGTYEIRSRIATDYSSIIPEGRMLGRQVRVEFQNESK